MTSSWREGLALAPEAKHKVWGGHRLVPGAQPPVGELWVAYEGSRIRGGVYGGRTLADVVRTHGQRLLGERVSGDRFPLLLKLIDTSDWLSVQVHPDDAQASALEGPGQRGKTECWYVLEADPGATLLCGVVPGTSAEALRVAVGTRTLVSYLKPHAVASGDAFLVEAGTAHALGPGLTLFELQQASDITYRMYDWDRPAEHGRDLHPEQSAAVTDVDQCPGALPPPAEQGGTIAACEHFHLSLTVAAGRTAEGDTGGATFHTLTVVRGSACVIWEGWSGTLKPYDTLLVPAAVGRYQVVPEGTVELLTSSA